MHIVKVGDTQSAICNKCKKRVEVTYRLKDVPFSDGSGTVKNVMSGVCNQCDTVAVMPHQSTAAIKRQIVQQRKAMESRVPAHMIDILSMSSQALGGTSLSGLNILKYYIHMLSTGEMPSKRLKHYLKTELATGIADKRISLKGINIKKDTARLKSLTEINNDTDLIKSVVLKINDDILTKKNAKNMAGLKNFIAATS